MRRVLLMLALFINLIVFADDVSLPGISSSNETENYVVYGHGRDDELFLDPILSLELKNLSGKSVLDAGCGAAPFSILAAQNGAQVYGIDMQKQMIEKAQIAIATAGVQNQVSLLIGNVEKLPFEASLFDRALSINLGCNLARTMQIVSDNTFEVIGLGGHFRELFRVLKEEGVAIVAAPASLGVVFTDTSSDESASKQHIEAVLAKIGDSDSSDVIIKNLSELTEILRATFVKRAGKLILVTDETILKSGEPIWRKMPECVVPNYYHSEEEYLVSLKNAGLICTEVKRPCFFGKVKYDLYRQSLKQGEIGLGEAYMHNHPFTIYYVTKKA